MGSTQDRKYAEFLEKQIGKVIYFSEMENVSDTVAVHEVRKSFKRIRALLRFYPKEFVDYSNQLKHDVAGFGRSLSSYRNACVNLQIIDRIGKETPNIPEKKIKEIKDLLQATCKGLLDNEVIQPGVRLQIQNYFRNREKEVQQNIQQLNWEDTAEQYINSYRKCVESYQTEGLFEDSEALHDLRKRLKVVYYQTNFLKCRNARYFKSRSDQLHSITELLGDEHDLYIFYLELTQEKYGLSQHEMELLANKISHQRDLLVAKLQPRLKQFLSETLEGFAEKIEDMLKTDTMG